MDIGSFLGGRYLGAVDLPQAYQTWTIQAVGQEVVDGQPRIYVKFFEHQKPYLANKTNLTSLAQGLGRESQNWINQRVEVTRQPTTFQGRACEGIRLRSPRPARAISSRLHRNRWHSSRSLLHHNSRSSCSPRGPGSRLPSNHSRPGSRRSNRLASPRSPPSSNNRLELSAAQAHLPGELHRSRELPK